MSEQTDRERLVEIIEENLCGKNNETVILQSDRVAGAILKEFVRKDNLFSGAVTQFTGVDLRKFIEENGYVLKSSLLAKLEGMKQEMNFLKVGYIAKGGLLHFKKISECLDEVKGLLK